METQSRKSVLTTCLLTSLAISAVTGAEPTSLLNGTDLDGWKCKPENLVIHWKAEDGQVVGENADKKGSVLWTAKAFANFDLELEYKTPSKDYDSGVFARGQSHQVQIGVSRSLKKDLTACIYAPKDKAGKYPATSDKVAAVHKLGEWNKLRIVVDGKRIRTFLNDEAFVDYEGKVIPDKGPIGLQLHGGVHMKMLFRNITITELE